MSWNPFRKVKRTRTEDVEFEREINKLRQMQAVSKRMYKDMRKCNENETAWMRCGSRIVTDIKTSPLGRSEPLKQTGESLGEVMEELTTHSKALKTNQEETFSNPIKKFNGVYKHVEVHAKQRELKQQEYDKQQAKLDKVGRRTTAVQPGAQAKLDLLQRSLSSAKADYERVHGRVMHDMPQLYENRLGYFDHCLQAIIKAQALYYHDCSETLLKGACNMQKEFGPLGDEGQLRAEEDIARTNDKYLDEIRGLSIVGTSPTS